MTNFQICNPRDQKHRVAMVWFSSIMNASKVNGSSFNRATEFYSIYSETGDVRYLNLSEDFMKDGLQYDLVKRCPTT